MKHEVTSDLNDELIKDVDMIELENVLKSSQKRRSPGKDGMNVEFYLQFWPIIKNTMLEVINYMKNNYIHYQQKEGVMVLIPKKKYPKRPDDFRPITLLNVDYKLFTRLLACRLRKMIHTCIHENQGAVIPGYCATLDLIKIRKFIEHVSANRLLACLISIDFTSAIDKITHQYLYKVLEKKGFHPKFISLIRHCYTHATTQCQVNGFLSRPFEIARGIRQGCPMSVLLFAIAVDPLISKLSSQLQGIEINNNHFAATAYVDDLNFVLMNQSESLIAMNLLNSYCHSSASEINTMKSTALALGTWNTHFALDFPYVDSSKILGIKFSTELQNTQQLTFLPIVNTIKGICQEKNCEN